MFKKIVLLLVILGVIGGVAYAVRMKTQAREKPEIRTAKVERGDVTSTVTATGTLQALTTVDIKSKAGGRVDKLAVDVGTEVKPGQLIAKIDPSDTLLVVQTATADMAASKAKVKQAEDNLRLQEADNAAQLLQAQEGLRAAKIRLAQAKKEAAVQPDLTKTSIGQAQASYDAAVQALRELETATIPQERASAQAAYDEAKANLNSALESQNMLEKATLPQDLAAAKAAYDQAVANVDIANKDLKRQTDLRAKGFVAQSVVDTAQNRYDLAVAQAASAKEKMNTIKAEHQSDLQSARHRVAQARAGVDSTKRKLDTLDAEHAAVLASARSKVAQAKAALDNARANSIQDELKKDDVAAATAAVKQAQAALDTALANKIQLQVRAADIATAKSEVASSDAKVKNAQTQLDQTTITAPRAGVILQKYVEEGTIITSGTSAIAQGTNIVQLGDISRMFVNVLVDETDIGSVDLGQKVDITVDAYPSTLFEGKVTRLDPQATTTQNVTTVLVVVEVDNPDKRLKPGMNATCDFIVDEAKDALLVPNEAVHENDNGESTVTVLKKDGTQEIRKVETGIVGKDSTEIRSGLKEGEEVVTAIIERKDGAGGGQGSNQLMRGMRGMGGGH